MEIRDKFEEQVLSTTTRIKTPQSNGKGTSISTGFLLNAPLNDGTNMHVTLLISNKDVFQNTNGAISFNFWKKNVAKNRR